MFDGWGWVGSLQSFAYESPALFTMAAVVAFGVVAGLAVQIIIWLLPPKGED